MNLDRFYDRTYNERTYNCAHFVVEVWQALKGEDLSEKLTGFMTSKDKRVVNPKIRFGFTRLKEPESPCLIVMHKHRQGSHVGIYLNGKILHIGESGVQHVPIGLATFGFDRYGFYK